MSDDLARRVRAARPSAVATVPARDRALAASRAALADLPRGASARRRSRLVLAVAGLAATATAAAVAVVLVLAAGAGDAPRIILPGDDVPAAVAPPGGDAPAEVTGADPSRPPAPEIDLPLLRPGPGPGLLGGDRLRLADLRGSVVVLAFTASWCEPCRTLPDTLQHADTGAGPRGAVVVAVGSRDLEDRARTLVVPGTSYAVAHDPDGKAGEALGAVAFPEIVVIDRQGRIAARLRGETSAAELESVLDPIVD